MLTGKAADPTGGVLGSPVGVTGACEGEEPAGPGRDAGPATVGWPAGTCAGELPSTAGSVKAAVGAVATATRPPPPPVCVLALWPLPPRGAQQLAPPVPIALPGVAGEQVTEAEQAGPRRQIRRSCRCRGPSRPTVLRYQPDQPGTRSAARDHEIVRPASGRGYCNKLAGRRVSGVMAARDQAED